MIIKQAVEVTCAQCNTLNNILPADIDQPEKSMESRSMGVETEYHWDHEFNCSHCDSRIQFEISAFEYPPGFLNFTDSNCKGGSFIHKPIAGIDAEQD